MAIIQTKDLSMGMMVAENVYSKAGQLIIRKDSLLTRQMIAHLKYYSIPEIEVLDGELPEYILHALESQAKYENTQLEHIFNSQEYKVFKKNYVSNVNNLQVAVNDIILRNVPIDQPKVIEQTVNIFDNCESYFSLFGMLHSMKQIDDSTFAHSVNVAMIARLIGTWSGFDEETLNQLTLAGLLHDIGKCQIPDEILMKPQRLSKPEYEFVKMHSQFGYDCIKNQDLDLRVKRAVLHHHERCDGSGYPYGLSAEQLEDFECIIAIADVYDAMTADRCYRSALCPFEAIAFFEQEGLQKYHPKYITVFLQKIANTYLNSDVLLSNNEVGRIVYINTRLTRPIIQLQNKEFINLLEHPDIYIHSII